MYTASESLIQGFEIITEINAYCNANSGQRADNVTPVTFDL